MDSEYVGGHNKITAGGATPEARVANKRRVGSMESLLRVVAVLLTLTAALTQALDKQTTTATIKLVPTLPAIDVQVTAKWLHLSAFVYLVAVNIIACVYAAFSLVLSFATRGTKKSSLEVLIIVLDMLMVALLFSAIGAATAIGLIGYNGNSHVKWDKVCYVFGKFCHQVIAAVILTQLGALAFILLVVLAVSRLNKRSTY